MSVAAVAEHVVAVLTRAEALFTGTGGPEGWDASEARGAVDAVGAADQHVAELGGQFGSAYRARRAAMAEQLETAAAADERLAAILTEAAERHDAARTMLVSLRESATAIPDVYATVAHAPGSEQVALKALRAKLLAAQRLIAEQSRQAQETARKVAGIAYT